MQFIIAHLSVFAGFAIAAIDVIVDVFHPNEKVTGLLNWILPFLRRSAGQ